MYDPLTRSNFVDASSDVTTSDIESHEIQLAEKFHGIVHTGTFVENFIALQNRKSTSYMTALVKLLQMLQSDDP